MTIEVVSQSTFEPKAVAPVETKAEPKPAPVEETEQKAAATSEAAETEEVTSDESEAEGEELEASEESQEEKPRKKGGFQRRIDKLNARAAAAERRAQELEARLAGMKPAAEEPKQVEAKATITNDEPDPNTFETNAEYLKAVAKWTLAQERKAEQAEQEKSRIVSEQEKLWNAHLEREKSFAEKTDDYAEVMAKVRGFSDASPTLGEMIINSDVGPELMYALAKDPTEYKRINALSPLAAAREIGKLESKLVAKSAEPKIETKKLTKAPPPVSPVGSKGVVATKSLSEMDYEEYKRARMAENKRK